MRYTLQKQRGGPPSRISDTDTPATGRKRHTTIGDTGTIFSKWLGKNKKAMVIIRHDGTGLVRTMYYFLAPQTGRLPLAATYALDTIRQGQEDGLYSGTRLKHCNNRDSDISNSTLTRSFHPFYRRLLSNSIFPPRSASKSARPESDTRRRTPS